MHLPKPTLLLGAVVAVALSMVVVLQTDISGSISIEDTDAMEYQLLAVNLSEFGVFPVTGFLASPQFYRLDTAGDLSLSNRVRLELTLTSGPVIGLGKPPLYPLVLASIYAAIGPDGRVPFWINVVMMMITAFIIFMGVAFAMRGFNILISIPTAMVAATYYVSTVHGLANHALPGLLLHLLVAMLSLAVLFDRSHHWFTGLLLGLLLLTNGNMLPMAFAFIVLLAALRWKRQERSPLVMALVAALVVLTWSAYANVQLYRSADDRRDWRETMLEDTLPLMQSQPGFDRRAGSLQDSMITRLIINRMYSRYADDGFVIMSKQPFGDEILSVHNEYAYDGSWHPEWRHVENSYHNSKNAGSGLLSRVLLFYWDNPGFLARNAKGKLIGVMHPHIHTLFLSMVLLACMILLPLGSFRARILLLALCCSAYIVFDPFAQGLIFTGLTLFTALWFGLGRDRGIPDTMVLLTAGALGVVSITFIFIGVPRYAQTIDPLVLIALAQMAGQMKTEARKALIGSRN